MGKVFPLLSVVPGTNKRISDLSALDVIDRKLVQLPFKFYSGSQVFQVNRLTRAVKQLQLDWKPILFHSGLTFWVETLLGLQQDGWDACIHFVSAAVQTAVSS